MDPAASSMLPHSLVSRRRSSPQRSISARSKSVSEKLICRAPYVAVAVATVTCRISVRGSALHTSDPRHSRAVPTRSADEVAAHPPRAVLVAHRDHGLYRLLLPLELGGVFHHHVLPVRRAGHGGGEACVA